jgi:hypothetical protein
MDLINDENYKLLNSGKSWGDIAFDSDSVLSMTPSVTPCTTPRPFPSPQDEAPSWMRITPENEDTFFAYEIPDLVMRKDIWTNFPVTLIPLGKDESGAERHSVQWHRKNLVDGRDEADFNEYVERTERHLLKALNASSKWDVLDSETEEWFVPGKDLGEIRKEICIIRMIFLPSTAEAVMEPEATEVSEPSHGPKPVLKKLNDIKLYFPVVWHSQPPEAGHPIYALEIHGKQARDRGLDMATLKPDLMAALRQSTAWRVLAGNKPTEVCRLELAFKAVD